MAVRELFKELEVETGSKWEPGYALRESLGLIVDRVQWPSVDSVAAFGKDVQHLTMNLSSDRNKNAFKPALALVMTAWDVELRREQFVELQLPLIDIGRASKTKTVSPGSESSFSRTWPWKKVEGKYVLGDFRIFPIFGNSRDTIETHVLAWNKRSEFTAQD
ncbi:hypothetical protein EON81_02120 [bacterium]|nr:MAG: hypothetical protein EON81_02120 [bacterium]